MLPADIRLRSRRRVALVLLLVLGSLTDSPAAVPNYSIHAWGMKDGLPQNAVNAIVQTHDGYLWVGTYNGLARFDGVRFTVFNNNNTPQMHSSRVTSLFEADDGTLWIGHETGEVTRYKDGQFQAVEIDARWSGGKIQEIGADESGDVWVLNEEGLLARLKDGVVLTPQAGSVAKLVEMAQSESGVIWVSRAGKVSRLERGQLTPLNFEEDPSYAYVQGIGASRDGGLWVASDGRVRKWKDKRWVEDLGPAPWGGTPIHRLMETRAGVLVAGTADHGFYLVFPNGNKQSLQFNRTNGFPSDWVISVCEDREGNLWAGTGGAGLVTVRAGNVQTIGPPDQWQERPVLSVTTDRTGALWIGTEGAGLYRFQDGRWDNFSGNAGIANPYVWSIAEDADGDLWVGTWGGGLFVRRGDRFERAPGIENVTRPMPALFCSRQGGLWIGTEAGLLRYDDGRATWFGREEKARDVRAVIEDSKGTIWFGMSGGGLGCLKDGEILQFRKADGLASDYVECLRSDSEGTLWIGTFGGGLTRLKKGRFAVIDDRHGLPNNDICHIEEDNRGIFWMSSLGGIIRVSKTELDDCADGRTGKIHCLTYGLSEGLPTLECSGGLQPAGCKTPDGRLWFPTTKGLVIVDPQNVKTNQLQPPVVIEKFVVDDRPVTNMSVSSSLRISPGRRFFEFQYTGLSFAAPEKVRFKYRLEGLETGWREAGTTRTANYSFVPPGDYTFRVIACNNDQIWNEKGATLSFIVLPYFWQTLWFRVLAGAVIAAGGGGIVWLDARRRTRRKLERLERQQAIERERSRIARDIHDDLGASLTRITMLSQSAHGEPEDPAQAAASLDQIYGTARELTRAMDEIVWAVNPRHDTLDSLATYLAKFAQDYLGAAHIRFRLDVPVQLPAWSLTAEIRHNLFLAFKEALHNVVKHAAASEVRVSLIFQKTGFELQVEDNGRGFAADTMRENRTDDPDRFAHGNGLINMKRRLAEIGGRCEIQSALERGTKVKFVVPVNTPPA